MNVQGNIEIHLEGEGDPANSKHYNRPLHLPRCASTGGDHQAYWQRQEIQTDLL
jgi:hypothetical protein